MLNRQIKDNNGKDRNILGQFRLFTSTDNEDNQCLAEFYAPNWLFKSIIKRVVPKNSMEKAYCQTLQR